MSRITDALRSLGLTEYGARAYEALVGLGPSGATEVAEAAQLPRTKSYAVLDELIDKGWATADDGRPRVYRAADPNTIIDRERAALVREVEHAKDALAMLYKEKGIRYGGAMWVVSGADAVVARSIEMIERAKTAVFSGYAFPLKGDERFFEALRRAADRGVRVRLLVGDPVLVDGKWRKGFKGEVRQGLVPLRILFADQHQSLVAFLRQQPDGSREARGLWNPNPEIIEQVFGVSEGLWEGGRPLD